MRKEKGPLEAEGVRDEDTVARASSRTGGARARVETERADRASMIEEERKGRKGERKRVAVIAQNEKKEREMNVLRHT